LEKWYQRHYENDPKLESEVLPNFEPDLTKKGEYFEGIYLDPTIPDSMYRALAKDICSIRHLKIANSPEEPDVIENLQSLLKIQEVTGESLLLWLRERVKYIVGHEYTEMARRLELPKDQAVALDKSSPLGRYYMANLGASYYRHFDMIFSAKSYL